MVRGYLGKNFGNSEGLSGKFFSGFEKNGKHFQTFTRFDTEQL